MSLKTSVLGMVVLGALLALAACKGGGGDSAATPAAEPSPTVAASPPPSAQLCPRIDGEVVQSVVALLELDRFTFRQGEPIEMTMRLVNCASQPITRTFPDAQRYDFVAKKPTGEEVWRWSNGMEFAQVQGEETYEPGEQRTFTETWDQVDNEGQPVEPGKYEIVVEGTGCDESLQNCGPRASLFIDIVAP